MKRFSRKWFAQIMIHRLLKRELDQLKVTIAKEMNATWKLSYNDVIKQLIKNYKESRRIEVPLEPKLFLSNSLKNSRLKISLKLDGKQRVSYSLEN